MKPVLADIVILTIRILFLKGYLNMFYLLFIPRVSRVIYVDLVQVTTNPSAVGGCSCKSSFMVKQ